MEVLNPDMVLDGYLSDDDGAENCMYEDLDMVCGVYERFVSEYLFYYFMR